METVLTGFGPGLNVGRGNGVSGKTEEADQILWDQIGHSSSQMSLIFLRAIVFGYFWFGFAQHLVQCELPQKSTLTGVKSH